MGRGDWNQAKEHLARQEKAGQQLNNWGTQLGGTGIDLYNQNLDTYNKMYQGGTESARVMAPQLNQVKRQFGVQRQRINDMAPGQQRDRYERELALGEAGALSDVLNAGVQQGLTGRENAANTGLQSGRSLLGMQADIQKDLANTRSQRSNAKAQAWGSFAEGSGQAVGSMSGSGNKAGAAGSAAGGVG